MATKKWLYTLAAAYAIGVVLLALIIPAEASHPISMCLDIEPDRDGVTVGSDSTLQAFIGISDSDHPPDTECHLDGFEAGTDMQIDFEITGAGDEDGATPSTPDFSCEVPAGNNSCFIEPPSSGNGDQQIQAWIDQDRDDGTVELDTSEGWDEESTPGEVAEPDGTDVAFWTWVGSDARRWDTEITIDYSRRREEMRGRVISAHRRCEARLVLLKRHRPGRDATIGRDRTDGSDSIWHIRFMGSPGRFYALVHRKTFTDSDGAPTRCRSDRSRTIRVR